MNKLIKEGLTFDDVLIVPAKSDVLPIEVDIKTKLTQKITLNAPIMSSSMDTVTESRMAIAMARQGGIGIIHKNMSIEAQASEVDKVKRSEHGVITDPFFLSPNNYVHEANALMAKYQISGVPITENDKLVGIITNRDMRFETNHQKKIYEVMTKENLITAPEGTTIEQAKMILTKNKIEKLPIVDARKILKGLITIKDIEKTIKYPTSSKDDYGRLVVGASVGVRGNFMERIEALIESKVDVIVVDISHAHSKSVINIVKDIRDTFKDIDLIVGNVVTKEATIDLIKAGASAIKVGFGAGSICTTRVITGVGVPQITAIYDCFEVAKEYKIPIISDGGIRYSGDITKALASGANVCMIGSLFVGCEESPGSIELFKGRKFKVYKGIFEDLDENAENYKNTVKLVPEGVEGRIAYKGSISDVVYQLLGGLRSGMGYCGAQNIEQLKNDTKFMKVTSSCVRENHPHSIQITKEASNYSLEY